MLVTLFNSFRGWLLIVIFTQFLQCNKKVSEYWIVVMYWVI